MEDRVAVVAGLPSRRDQLAGALEESGWDAIPVAPGVPLADVRAVVLDLSDLAPADACDAVRALDYDGPVLVLGSRHDLPALEAAVGAGADDFALDPGRAELGTRLSLLLAARRRHETASRREAALVELAAAAGETLEPTAVLRAILDWLKRVVPVAEPSVVLAPRDKNGPTRVVQPGPGRTLTFARTELSERPELRRTLEGERMVRLDDAVTDPELRASRARLLAAGWSDALAVALRDAGRTSGVLSVRAKRRLEAEEISLVRAAAILSARALWNARAHDATSRERERLERAYADRYRELLDANRRLRELSHQKDELLGICAHDLRQPLVAMRGHTRHLLDAELADEVRDPIEAIDRQAARMSELIEDLLDLHAIETGRLELKAQPLDLGELAREVADALEVTASDRGVQLEFRQEGKPPRISGDPSKLREVIANLVGNAVKFSPPGATVRVVAEQLPEGGGRVRVQDQGPGIPPEMLSSLLTGIAPPQPTPEPAARKGEGRGRGRGLGLAIAREITMLHGGRLTAESQVGAGSTFTVELPSQPRAAERPAATAAPAQPAPSLVRPRVLVVEDDEDVRMLLVHLLEEDHEVIEAADGEQGVERAKEEAPDVILMDLFLPKKDGFSALEDLKRDPRTAEIPVIFLSAERDESTRVRGLDLGAADFLVKPFGAVELRARISKALRAARQQEQLRTIAQTDALTGLPNYRAFRGRLEEEVKRARRYHTPLSAIMVDLDNLKPINDQLGHAAGNRAIVALAEAVKAELRETDFAARYGGDEFVILLPHSSASEARAVADRLRRAIRRVEVDGPSFPLRASLGVAALAPGGEGSADALIRAADAALYRAKGTGRDRVCVAGEEPAGRDAHVTA